SLITHPPFSLSPLAPVSDLSAPSSFPSLLLLFFFNDPATTEIYTLSLHDALPISRTPSLVRRRPARRASRARTASENSVVRARSKRSSTAVDTLLTFCPPGPEARTK